MDVEELIEKIRTGSRAPLYLLHGEEPFFIDQISNYIQDHLLNETEQVFNQRMDLLRLKLLLYHQSYILIIMVFQDNGIVELQLHRLQLEYCRHRSQNLDLL